MESAQQESNLKGGKKPKSKSYLSNSCGLGSQKDLENQQGL